MRADPPLTVAVAPGSAPQQVLDVLLGAPLHIVGVIVVAVLARWVLHRAISGFIDRAVAASPHERLTEGPARLLLDAGGLVAERRRQRLATMGSALRSLASFTVAGVALATILGELGVNLGPLLASAGIAGAALGFGAQSLVRDVLTGAFLIVEDQYGVGDTIDLGTVAGTVEAVGLRVTRLRDADGVVWYVRNGEIVRVGNRSQGWSTATVDVPVAYDEDLERARTVLAAAVAGLAEEPEWRGRVLDTPEVVGVEALAADGITLRLLVRAAPGEQLSVQRELRRRVKAGFDAAGVRVAPGPPAAAAPPAPTAPGRP